MSRSIVRRFCEGAAIPLAISTVVFCAGVILAVREGSHTPLLDGFTVVQLGFLLSSFGGFLSLGIIGSGDWNADMLWRGLGTLTVLFVIGATVFT